MNDLTENLDSNPKHIFSIVKNVAQSNNSQLSSDLTKINDWAYKWQISFNPDYTKPVQKVVFSGKRSSETHHLLFMINNVPVKRVPFCKHLRLILDSKLDFNKHILTPCCPKLII